MSARWHDALCCSEVQDGLSTGQVRTCGKACCHDVCICDARMVHAYAHVVTSGCTTCSHLISTESILEVHILHMISGLLQIDRHAHKLPNCAPLIPCICNMLDGISQRGWSFIQSRGLKLTWDPALTFCVRPNTLPSPFEGAAASGSSSSSSSSSCCPCSSAMVHWDNTCRHLQTTPVHLVAVIWGKAREGKAWVIVEGMTRDNVVLCATIVAGSMMTQLGSSNQQAAVQWHMLWAKGASQGGIN